MKYRALIARVFLLAFLDESLIKGALAEGASPRKKGPCQITVERLIATNTAGNDDVYLKEMKSALSQLRKTESNEQDRVLCLVGIGETYYTGGRFEEAIPYLDKALPILEKKGLTNQNYRIVSKELIKSYLLAGSVSDNVKFYKLAASLSRKNLEVSRTHFPHTHVEYVSDLGNLGHSLGYLGEDREALIYQREGLNIATTMFGKDSPKLIPWLNDILLTLDTLGMSDEFREKFDHLNRLKASSPKK